MADAFIGEIRLLPYSFWPVDWLWCTGVSLPVNQYQALYAVIGVTYGGTVGSTFKIPNLIGTVPIGLGAGPGLTARTQSENPLGAKTVTLNYNQAGNHTHTLNTKYLAGPLAGAMSSLLASPANDSWVSRAALTIGATNSAVSSYATGSPDTTLPNQTITPGGGSAGAVAPHENRQPFLPLNFCICTMGWYPVPND